MKNYTQQAEFVPFTAPPGGAVSGVGYLVGGLFLVATADIEAGERAQGNRYGGAELPRATGVANGELAKAYWDDTAKNVTTVSGGNTLIGVFATAYASGDTVASVFLNGTAVA